MLHDPTDAQHHTQKRKYAAGYRYGFNRGARDALRCAARELPPETWSTLHALTDRYAEVDADA